MMSDHNAIEFLDFCRNFDQAMLVTHSPEGLIARPMVIAEIDSLGYFWFSTDVASGKVEEIKSNPRARSAILRVAERTATPYVPYNRTEPDARWRN